MKDRFDVVIVGAGLAGLTLARQLLLETDKTVLLLERRASVPPERQKVGESLVQLAGHYFSKVLDLEEHLLREHFMKYNLRFYWKTPGHENSRFEEYSKGYIRPFSNIASYQLDRNKVESELLRLNSESERFTFQPSTSRLDVKQIEGEDHELSFTVGGDLHETAARWVVDTSGRGRFLARQKDTRRANAIRHGAFFWWVDGLVDVDKLTDLSPKEIRLKRERRATGHLPSWMATNHFMGEGLWFWVIPLQGKTSLGLVYDSAVVPHDEVFSVDKATAWVCREFPLFARDLPQREVLDHGGYRDFSHDCVQTISSSRWAMTGEAGRFTDPLYSPGSDLIAIYNTLVVDAIETSDGAQLEEKCRLYEQLMRSVYAAYVPSYATSYDALGDQETFCLKYAWELTIYFAGYVFPFINDLFTERRFALGFLRLFSRLGPMNLGVQELLSAYFQWKQGNRVPPAAPTFFDFTEIEALRRAELTFYEVGVSVEEAKRILAEQIDNAEELARFIFAHVASVTLGDERVLTNGSFIPTIDVANLRFDPAEMRQNYEPHADSDLIHEWSFDPRVMRRFSSEAGTGTGAEPADRSLSAGRSVAPARGRVTTVSRGASGDSRVASQEVQS